MMESNTAGIFLRLKIAALIPMVALLVALSFASCKESKTPKEFSSKDINNIITRMTEIMVHDITNPPLAARFFSYACLAGYEIISQNDPASKSMYGIINDYPSIPKPDSIGVYSYQLASLLAMMETAKKMQPSGKELNNYQENFLDSCKREGFDETVIEQSQHYADIISEQILAYAKSDGYNKISNLSRYTPVLADGNWYPTPPGFMAAVEPYFHTIRPFMLDSSARFKPDPPAPYSSQKKSAFYQLTEAVYKEGITLEPEHRAIAAFWDCNPFAMQEEGHLQYGFKKISPGAHWLGITGIACEGAKKRFNESMKIMTVISMGLMDAFICCWDEKFRSNRVRPETAIRKLIDPSWQPLLQTPPFPEYLSGHSTVSSTSAVLLTHYFGDNFAYTDSVEVSYGLPARQFTSFNQAASEAAISRFYGGIHFMDAIDNGMIQGAKLGEWIIGKLGGK